MSKKTQIDAIVHSGTTGIRNFIDQETPPVGTWNRNPNAERSTFDLIGDFFDELDATLAAAAALFAADHDPATGKNPVPAEWVPDTGPPPVFLGQAQFRLTGDRRADYAKGHRVRLTIGASTVIVGLTDVFYDAPTGVTRCTVSPPVLTAGLSALARALVRFSAPQVTQNDLTTGCVTPDALAAFAVGTAAIADLAILTQHLANGIVTAPKIAAGAVGTAQLANAGVTGTKVANATLLAQHLADGAVSTAKLADGAVTEPKLASGAVSARVVGLGQVLAVHLQPGLLENLATMNLLRNGSFEVFSAGDIAAPDGWALVGAGAVASRTPAAFRFGVAAARLRAGGAPSMLTQRPVAVGNAVNPGLQGVPVTLAVWVQANVPNVAAVSLADNGSEDQSTPHLGNGWQLLTVTHTIDPVATFLEVRLRNLSADGATAVLFDGAMLVLGTVPATSFFAHPDDEHLVAVDYQDLATNRVLGGLRVQMGWTFATVTGAGLTLLDVPVTFPRPFKTLLAVSMQCVGFKPNADPTTLLDSTPFTAVSQDPPRVVAHSLTLAGFHGMATSPGGGSFGTANARRFLFCWEAKGIG